MLRRGPVAPLTIFIRNRLTMSSTTTTTAGSLTGDSLRSAIQSHQTLGKPAHVEVIDTSGGCGQSFNVVIVSDVFEGKSLIQRHRLVNDALKSEIQRMHAFSQKCLTTAQWKQQQQ